MINIFDLNCCLSGYIFQHSRAAVFFFYELKITQYFNISENNPVIRLAVRYGKKSPNQESGLGKRGCLKFLNDTTLILNNEEAHSFSFRTNLVSFRIFRRPLFSTPVSWLGLFCRFLQQEGSSFLAKNQYSKRKLLYFVN